MSKVLVMVLAAIALAVMYTIGIYNTIQKTDETVTSSWSEVVNQFQRRSDLLPNVLETAKSYAGFEKKAILDVVEARNKVTSMKPTQEMINDPKAFQEFMAAQNGLGKAMSNFNLTVERYPELKSSRLFENVQTSLEGAENRIAIARKKYINAVKDFNLAIRKFPGNFVARNFGYTAKQNFSVENEAEISRPPVMDFKVPEVNN